LVIGRDECVNMIWHQHIRSDPCTMLRTLFGKMKKAFVDCLGGENMATVRFSAVTDRRYRLSRRRASSFSWILSNPPLLKTTTTSFGRSIGMMRSTIALAFCS